MQSFFDAVPQVQRLVESSPSFIWRKLKKDDSTIAKRLDPDFIVNLSAWESSDALCAFVFSQPHRHMMMARDYWFTHACKPLSVVWFADNAPYPKWEQAIDHLEILWQTGPTQDVFYYSWASANALTPKSLEL